MKDIKRQAIQELADEKFRAAVDKEKARIRARPIFWKRLFPWRIVNVNKVRAEKCSTSKQ